MKLTTLIFLVISCLAWQPADIRLAGTGSTPFAGRIEVYAGGKWGTVCNDGFDAAEGAVACRQLGHSDTGFSLINFQAEQGNTVYGPGTGSILMDNVNCNGAELSLFDCHYIPDTKGNCGHHEDIMIQCVPNAPPRAPPRAPPIIASLPLTSFSSNPGGFHPHCPDPRKSSGTAWCCNQCSSAQTNIQVNFDKMHLIKAVGTLGRKNYGQWVKTYNLQYSEDGTTFKDDGIDNPLPGNSNQNTEVIHTLNKYAKSLRFTPVTWHGWKSMRIEAYGYWEM